jgi:MFS family permease
MNHPKKIITSIGKTSISGISFKAAKKTREFWALCLIQLIVITILLEIPVHLAENGIDLGMTPTKASILLSVIGASSIAGRLAVGIFFDRLGGNVAFFLCLLPLATSLFGFSYVDSHVALFFMAAIYGFGHGGFFTVISPLIADLFGMKEHGTIFGTILFSGSIGGSVGPIAVGWIFDITGSYYHAFISLGYLAIFALILSLFINKKKV